MGKARLANSSCPAPMHVAQITLALPEDKKSALLFKIKALAYVI